MLSIQSIEMVAPTSYKEFSCGIVDLDTYLKRFAKTNHKKNIGKTFVLLTDEKVIGFYTISMASIEFANIPKNLNSGIPKYPIPVARIGRLAVDQSFQKQNLGRVLLIDALQKILEASKIVAAHAVVVDAKNDRAKKFYLKLGFIQYENNTMSLYLPMTSIENLFC